MKKVIFAITAFLITFGIYANVEGAAEKKSNHVSNYSNYVMDLNADNLAGQNIQCTQDTLKYNEMMKDHPNGVMMQDGKMWLIKDNVFSLLEQSIVMKNGTTVMVDGQYTKKNGTKMMFKEGEHMDMEGKLIPMKSKSVK